MFLSGPIRHLLLERASARQRVQVGGYEAGARVALEPPRSQDTSRNENSAWRIGWPSAAPKLKSVLTNCFVKAPCDYGRTESACQNKLPLSPVSHIFLTC